MPKSLREALIVSQVLVVYFQRHCLDDVDSK